MSDTEIISIERDPDLAVEKQRPAHLFKPGQSGNPKGRPKGARSVFSQNFIQDLASIWEERGIAVLQEVATNEPGTFLKVCASLMPRDLNLSVALDPATFRTRFEEAVRLLGNEPRGIKVIDG